MPWPMIAAAVGSGILGYIGSQSQNEASIEAAEASRDLPDWLKPYYVGEAGPLPEQEPLNYNWLDAVNQAAATGMPQNMPPMSMNNPMMTLQNVHTPVQGGPWGHGMGPGQPTVQGDIPGAPGPQFVQPGAGFQPGPTGAGPAPDGGQGGGIMDPEVLAAAQAHHALVTRMHDIGQSGGDNAQTAAPSIFDSMAFASRNPGVTGQGGIYDAMIQERLAATAHLRS